MQGRQAAFPTVRQQFKGFSTVTAAHKEQRSDVNPAFTNLKFALVVPVSPSAAALLYIAVRVNLGFM